jgi:EAL domain-containing protein (putative c-di-GMP-specific phosphodiesterase class I)
VAEETGLIVPIGRWVLAEACRQAARWQQSHSGRLLQLCVNLSAREFQEPDLVASIERILAETGLAPASLCLELTETAVIQDTRQQ